MHHYVSGITMNTCCSIDMDGPKSIEHYFTVKWAVCNITQNSIRTSHLTQSEQVYSNDWFTVMHDQTLVVKSVFIVHQKDYNVAL